MSWCRHQHLLLRRILLLWVFLLMPFVLAQAPQEIIINYPEVIEDGQAQSLNMFFTVLDAGGRPIPNPSNIGGATLTLNDGSVINIGNVQRPETPLFITLVLDASGSMGSAVTVMREAANTAIRSAPPEAQIAVIQFNEQFQVLQNFTNDRNQAVNAVGRVQPQNNAGTCLFDAAFQATQLLRDTPPQGRRATILFTDGRDEVLGGERCSQRSLSEVIELAQDRQNPVSIHTIGLQGGQPIAAAELANLAQATGGLTAIGERQDLNNLFGQIMDGLRGQLLATAQLCLPQGSYAGAFAVQSGGQFLPPDGVSFQLQNTCEVPVTAAPTPTETLTPIPLELFVETFAFNPQEDVARFEIRRQGDGEISQYRIQVRDADSRRQIFEDRRVPEFGLITGYTFSTVDIPDSEIEIIVQAIGPAQTVLAQGDETFTITKPTATPTQTPVPSATPIAVNVVIIGLPYDPVEDVLRLQLNIRGAERIRNFELKLIDDSTNIEQATFSPALEPEIPLPLRDLNLTPEERYLVRLNIETDAGEFVQIEDEFVYAPELTPTPTQTNTPTNTPTVTPTASVDMRFALSEGERSTERILTIEALNTAPVDSYRITIVNDRTRLRERELVDIGVAETVIAIALDDLPSGEYEIVLTALDANGQRLAEFSEVVTHTLPPTETPSPTPTLTPTPFVNISFNPRPGSVNTEIVIDVEAQNVELIEFYRVTVVDSETNLELDEFEVRDPEATEITISLAEFESGEYEIILSALDADERRLNFHSTEVTYTSPPTPTPSPTPTITPTPTPVPFIDRMSATISSNPIVAVGVVLITVLLLGLLIWMIVRGRRRGAEDDWTVPAPDMGKTGVFNVPDAGGVGGDPDKTEVFVMGDLPSVPANLVIVRGSDPSLQNQLIQVIPPFKLGRTTTNPTTDFQFDEKSISREHAQITFENGQYSILDEGSANGTYVNGERIPANQSVSLKNGDVIRLGRIVELRIEIMDGGKTMIDDDATQVDF